MTAHETIQRALAALEAGDLGALGQAVADRATALRTASPSEQAAALADGATLSLRLAEFKRNLAAEHARLEQLREGLANYSGASFSSACIDLRG
jgi:hypothetical protein